MNKNNYRKLLTLLSLYIAQSVPMSFFSTVIPVIMRQENYSLESIGLLQLIKLPWIVKFLWAPMVDKSGSTPGGYVRWIIYSECIYAMVILITGFFSLQADFTLIAALMVLAITFSATQDIATDAFAIRILEKHDRGPGNSMQSAGAFLGTLLGSGVLLLVYHKFGWQYLISGLAVFVLLALLPLLVFRKSIRTVHSEHSERIKFRDIWHFFRSDHIRERIFYLSFFYSGLVGSLTMVKPYMVDLGYTIKQIGLISGVAGTGAAALAAMAAGIMIRKFGGYRVQIMICLFIILSSAWFLVLSLTIPPLPYLFAGIIILWAAYGMATVAVYTTSMNYVRAGREGTDFTIQIVLTHLSSLIIAAASGKIAGMLTYSGLFATEIVLGIATFFIIRMRVNRKW